MLSARNNLKFKFLGKTNFGCVVSVNVMRLKISRNHLLIARQARNSVAMTNTGVRPRACIVNSASCVSCCWEKLRQILAEELLLSLSIPRDLQGMSYALPEWPIRENDVMNSFTRAPLAPGVSSRE